MAASDVVVIVFAGLGLISEVIHTGLPLLAGEGPASGKKEVNKCPTAFRQMATVLTGVTGLGGSMVGGSTPDSKAVVPYNDMFLPRGGDDFMTMLTITAKGQVTLKRDLLKHLGVSPGERVEADRLPDGRIVVRAAAQDGRIGDFIGCLSQKGVTKLTVDEMNQIASRGWAKAK